MDPQVPGGAELAGGSSWFEDCRFFSGNATPVLVALQRSVAVSRISTAFLGQRVQVNNECWGVPVPGKAV